MRNITSILLSLAATSILPAAEVPDLTSVRQYLKPSVTDGTVAGGSVLIIHKGKAILLNRPAVESAIEMLQKLVATMDEDRNVDRPAVYDAKSMLPWWTPPSER